jgi:hypothetical protein
MTKRTLHHFRWMGKLAIILAAAPLFQLAQCDTGLLQVFAGVANAMPATMFSIMQGFLLLPLQLLSGSGGSGTAI